MAMKSIPVNSLKPGMAFDKAVYIDPDNKLVDINEPISQQDIERLEKWKIMEVQTAGSLIENIPTKTSEVQNIEEKIELDKISRQFETFVKTREEFENLVIEGKETLSEAYSAICAETPFQISRVRTLAENIVSLLDKSPNIFQCLYLQSPGNNIYMHVISAGFYSALLAESLQFSKPRIIELVFSILLMDVGMSLIPAALLTKTGTLTEAEITQVHAHPVKGYQLLTRVAKLKSSLAVVALEHHEHFDGMGYPRRIKGLSMSEYSRVAAIADSYAALLESKPYRGSILPYFAMKELLTLGIYRYDPIYLKSFLDRLSIYPIGSLVKLSDQSFGLIVSSVQGKPMRPVILLLKDSNGVLLQFPVFVHLLYHTDKYIVQALTVEESGVNLDKTLDYLVAQMHS